MKNVPVNGLYIKKLQVYDKNIFEHLYLKKGNKFINVKSEKVDTSIQESDLLKLYKSEVKDGKYDISDIKFILNKYITKGNYDINITLQRDYGKNDSALDYIYINPYHAAIEKNKYMIENYNDIEKIKIQMNGECILKGVVAVDGNNIQHKVKVYFNRESKNEPIQEYFIRGIKKLQLEKKPTNGGFFKK